MRLDALRPALLAAVVAASGLDGAREVVAVWTDEDGRPAAAQSPRRALLLALTEPLCPHEGDRVEYVYDETADELWQEVVGQRECKLLVTAETRYAGASVGAVSTIEAVRTGLSFWQIRGILDDAGIAIRNIGSPIVATQTLESGAGVSVAQLEVEIAWVQRTRNPRRPGSTPSMGASKAGYIKSVTIQGTLKPGAGDVDIETEATIETE